MTLQLRLYDDDGNQAPLPVGVLGGPVGGWSLQSAPVRAQSLMPYAVHDGPAVHERTRDLVSETVEVWIPKQASSYDLRDKVQAIETLLEKANRGGEVWVEYNTGEASDNLWRSPLMAGGLAWGPDMRLRWRNWEAHVRVQYSREPWWQGDSRTAQLASGSTLANANAPTVGQAGRVTARASNAAGVLPAPFKLTWTLPNTSVEDLRVYATQKHDASNSSAGLYTVASSIARTNLTAKTQSQILAAAMPSGTSGWRRVLVEATGAAALRNADRDAALWLRAGQGTAADLVERGAWTRAGYYEGRASRFSDLGTLYLARSHVYIMAYANGALQSSPMRVHLLPTDGYRSYHVAGASPASGALFDDGGELSGTAAGAGMADGEPLLLTPGRASELFVLMEDGAGDSPDDMTLAAAYRPRRLSI